MDAWYLVYTKPQQERVAQDNLQRQGYQTYLPVVRNRRRRRGRYVQVVESMFPRYMFIFLSNLTDNWGPIRSTIGIANIVRFAGQAVPVPDDLVAALRGREDESGVQTYAAPEIESGERVRIVEGVMAGYEAIFQAKTSESRVILLLEIAGKAARVRVGSDTIEAI